MLGRLTRVFGRNSVAGRRDGLPRTLASGDFDPILECGAVGVAALAVASPFDAIDRRDLGGAVLDRGRASAIEEAVFSMDVTNEAVPALEALIYPPVSRVRAA